MCAVLLSTKSYDKLLHICREISCIDTGEEEEFQE